MSSENLRLWAGADDAHSDTYSPQALFTRWALGSLAPLSTVVPGEPWNDLAPLGRMVGDAKIVALTEGVHCAAEPLQFRNRVLEYLVREKGFTAVAIESGIVESRAVHDYVRGGDGDLSDVLAQGIGWTFDRLPQNRELVRWLRQYNTDPRGSGKVNFYGFDVPGSAGNTNAKRGVDTALKVALSYLATVDSVAGALFANRLEGLLPNLRFDPQRDADTPGYDRLTGIQRDALTCAIDDLVALLERKEGQYTLTSSAHDYEWGYRSAIGARQVDHWLRQIPLGWQPTSAPLRLPSERAKFLLASEELRDRAQADNIEWIVRQEGPTGKILVFAHRYHLSASPVKRRFGDSEDSCHQVAGTYLRRRFREQLVTIGNLIGCGQVGCGGGAYALPTAPAESIDGLAGWLGRSAFLLDLRSAPPVVANWLDQERCQEVLTARPPQVFKLSVGRAFDVILYLNAVTPACGSVLSDH